MGTVTMLPGQKPLTPDKGFIKAFILYETKKCRNCGRKLRAERSIKNGFGPVCAEEFAGRFLNARPKYLGDRAKRLWTKEEIQSLIQFAREGRRG